MKILVWSKHPGDLLGEAIDFLTHGSTQHAGFLRKDGHIVEAYWPKVRQRAIVDAERQFLKAFELRGMTQDLHDAFEVQFDEILKTPPEYSGEDLFKFLFNQPNVDEKHTYCSRLVMHICMNVCPPEIWPLTRCMGPEVVHPDGKIDGADWISPRDLFVSNMLVPTTLD